MSYQEFLQHKLKTEASGGAHGSHCVYWVPAEVFASLPIQLWEHNRPPDPDRVNEIRAYLQESKRVDGILYLACIDNQLVCYEANHRREAIKGVEGLQPLLVDILWDATDEQVRNEFVRLNKAISVPDLYFRPNPSIELRALVDQFCKTYKEHKVNSNRPQRPNFTRDMLVEEFDRVLHEKNLTLPELESYLTSLNRTMTSRDRSGLHPRVVHKCEASGLWLFAWSSRLE